MASLEHRSDEAQAENDPQRWKHDHQQPQAVDEDVVPMGAGHPGPDEEFDGVDA